MVSLLVIVVERTDLGFVASAPVAVDSFVLVWVVEPLHSCVALVTEDSVRAHLPPSICGLRVAEILTILCCILENLRWSPEVTHVMGVDAALGVVGILAVGAPRCFILEHIERKHLHGLESRVQILVEGFCLK